MKVRRKCAACGEHWYAEVSDPFVTCPDCRRPVKEDGGGCRFWHHAAADPRVTTQADIRLEPRGTA